MMDNLIAKLKEEALRHEKEGYHIRQGKGLPCKTLAAHTGLGVYGRNNLIYIAYYRKALARNLKTLLAGSIHGNNG